MQSKGTEEVKNSTISTLITPLYQSLLIISISIKMREKERKILLIFFSKAPCIIHGMYTHGSDVSI